MTKIDQKMTKIGFYGGFESIFGSKYIFYVKITLVNPGVFDKPKIAHISVNNGRRAVLTPFLDSDIFSTFWG